MFTTQTLTRTAYGADMTSPQIPPAGVTGVPDSAKECLTWQPPPPTPGEQKKYRQSTVHEPGKIVKHPGLADDAVPSGPFGIKTKSAPGESVKEYFSQYPESDIARWKLDRQEDVYASTKREPLGRGYVRGHAIPSELATVRGFGMSYDAVGKEEARQAGKIIHPADGEVEEDPRVHAQYLASHTSYDPGEQRRRNYDWAAAGIDPATQRFGLTDREDLRDGVRKALQPALQLDAQGPARVLPKVHEDWKAATTDYLGRPRALGCAKAMPQDFTFGVPSLRHGPEQGVGELFKSGLSEQQQQPDADLGKSLRQGYRNVAPDGRVFGVPSIRTDLPLPSRKSVANTFNFGNEPDAQQLLAPSLSAERGISNEAYVVLRPKGEVRELVAEAELQLGDEEFEQAFAMASEADGQAGAHCCLDTFFRARHHVLSQTLVPSGAA